jgi:hypothetical protein
MVLSFVVLLCFTEVTRQLSLNFIEMHITRVTERFYEVLGQELVKDEETIIYI